MGLLDGSFRSPDFEAGLFYLLFACVVRRLTSRETNLVRGEVASHPAQHFDGQIRGASRHIIADSTHVSYFFTAASDPAPCSRAQSRNPLVYPHECNDRLARPQSIS